MATYWLLARRVNYRIGKANVLIATRPLIGKYTNHDAPPGQMGRLFETEWSLVECRYDGPAADVAALDSADVLVLPDPTTLVGDLRPPDRRRVRDMLQVACGTGYDYLRQDQQSINVPLLDVSDVMTSGTLTGQDVLDRLMLYLQIRQPTGLEGQSAVSEHNTEYTDNFDTDPLTGGRMTEMTFGGGTNFSYDGTDQEIDHSNPNDVEVLRYDSSVGSNEMEAQDTYLHGNNNGWPGIAVRCRPSTATTYIIQSDTQGPGGLTYWRNVAAGGWISVGSDAATISDSVWFTLRSSAETIGAAVTINSWLSNHTASKPADPGWIGSDGSPDETVDDTNAARIVDSDAQRGGLEADTLVTNYDYFKVRAISDRGGGRTPGVEEMQLLQSGYFVGRQWV